MKKYEAGELIRITAEFRDSANALQDPTKVVFSLRPASSKPLGDITTYTPTRESIGRFYVELTTWVPAGRWAYRFDGQGAVGTAQEGEFFVEGSDFE